MSRCKTLAQAYTINTRKTNLRLKTLAQLRYVSSLSLFLVNETEVNIYP